MKLNNKGFTLVEVLAVVIILGVLATIMVPTVSSAIKMYKEDSYKNLEKSIISAAKVYMSDNRYEISLKSGTCDNNNNTRDIFKISGIEIVDNKLFVNYLELSGNIKNPIDGRKLNSDLSYVIVKYSCESRDYIYSCFDDDESCNDAIKKSHLEWSNT